MQRQQLLSLLADYQTKDEREQRMVQEAIGFVQAHPDCFERSLLIGHVTGSAWVVSPDRKQVVLIHHRKLNRWFQPGGHADGDPDVLRVAWREAQEETGLSTIRVLSPAIFDVDIHPIPARKDVPEHLHYDIRFLFEAPTDQPFVATSETIDTRWVDLNAVDQLTTEESVLRMVRKMAVID